MRNSKRLIHIILIIIGFSLPRVGETSTHNLRVLTFNIWDPADIPFWEKHANGFPIDKVVKYITEDKADILLLQEVSLEMPPHEQAFDAIRNKLKEFGYPYTAYYKPDYPKGSGTVGYIKGSKNSGYPLAIFSKYPVIETLAVQTLNGKTMSKGVLAVKLRIMDTELFVFNTHLSIGDMETNDEVSKVALPFTNQVSGDELVIYGGDWNSPPAAEFPNSSQKIGKYTYSSKTTQFLLDDGFKDAWFEVARTKNIGKGATCPGQDDYIKRVDQIYYRGNGLYPVGAFVKHNLWEYIGLKDHIGLIVDFRINKT